MNYLHPVQPPLTWLDIERSLKEKTANYTRCEAGILAIRCFSDGAEIEYDGEKPAIFTWLTTVFGRYFSAEQFSITLGIAQAQYPIDFIQSPTTSVQAIPSYPLWSDQVYLNPAMQKYPPPNTEKPKIIAFHSFKGGVGRTTSLMTYAAALLNQANERPIKILLVDADLEAPGISFWLEPSNRPNVSFIQLLEALHFPPKDTDSTLEHFTNELRKTSLNIDGSNKEVFVLPAALKLTDIMDMPVQPQHIARNPRNPWQLSDHLSALGGKLNADLVLVDLRAGLSELASPLLFDPRIEHFFVTTVAPQSVKGMAEVLKHIHAFQSELQPEQAAAAKPSLILTMLTPQLRKLKEYEDAYEQLSRAYPNSTEDTLSYGLEFNEAEFDNSLMSIGDLKQALMLLPKSSLFTTARKWAESWFISQLTDTPTDISKTHSADTNQLHQICQQQLLSKSQPGDDFLITEPLRNLAKHYRHEVPNTVVIGAMGAGKTFTYLQLCQNQYWRQFLQKITSPIVDYIGDGIAPVIHPLLWSKDLGGDALRTVEQARANSCQQQRVAVQPQSVAKKVNAALSNGLTDDQGNWQQFWLQTIANEISNNAMINLQTLDIQLSAAGESIIFIIDGIEALLPNPEEATQRLALNALLTLPNQFSQLLNRRIGLLLFIRPDYIQDSVVPNSTQYSAAFESFKLQWTPDAFLRLVYWLCGKAGIIDAQTNKAEQLSLNQLLESLTALWGETLSNPGIKASNTTHWVYSALCDFKGQLQARDVVRFIKCAAQIQAQPDSKRLPDRLLSPETIRQSLPACSHEKVQEASLEIEAFSQWQKKLSTLAPEHLKVPFNYTELGLTDGLLDSLQTLGIVYENLDPPIESRRFYLPEIYRLGLNFKIGLSGEYGTSMLLRRGLGHLPF
ncbi:MAG: cellulose biosynthesis protein BcsQ [Phenylobacterium sp.]|jgi:cellulose biosynthesis protein BcsQ